MRKLVFTRTDRTFAGHPDFCVEVHFSCHVVMMAIHRQLDLRLKPGRRLFLCKTRKTAIIQLTVRACVILSPLNCFDIGSEMLGALGEISQVVRSGEDGIEPLHVILRLFDEVVAQYGSRCRAIRCTFMTHLVGFIQAELNEVIPGT